MTSPALMIAPPVLMLIMAAAMSCVGMALLHNPVFRRLLGVSAILEIAGAIFLVGFVLYAT